MGEPHADYPIAEVAADDIGSQTRTSHMVSILTIMV